MCMVNILKEIGLPSMELILNVIGLSSTELNQEAIGPFSTGNFLIKLGLSLSMVFTVAMILDGMVMIVTKLGLRSVQLGLRVYLIVDQDALMTFLGMMWGEEESEMESFWAGRMGLGQKGLDR